MFSQVDVDNEASRGAKNTDKGSEVSFVLERKSTESNGSPSKLGIFSIALVMCICCFSSFFSPSGTSLSSGSGSLGKPAIPVGRSLLEVGEGVEDLSASPQLSNL